MKTTMAKLVSFLLLVLFFVPTFPACGGSSPADYSKASLELGYRIGYTTYAWITWVNVLCLVSLVLVVLFVPKATVRVVPIVVAFVANMVSPLAGVEVVLVFISYALPWLYILIPLSLIYISFSKYCNEKATACLLWIGILSVIVIHLIIITTWGSFVLVFALIYYIMYGLLLHWVKKPENWQINPGESIVHNLTEQNEENEDEENSDE